MKNALIVLLFLVGFLSSGCSDTEDERPDGGTGDVDLASAAPRLGEIGTRCTTAGTCDVGLECRSNFFFERSVCTKACTVAADCSGGTVCVDDIPAYDATLVGPYCLRPCALQPECAAVLGSDCDTHDSLTARYCF